MKNDVSRCINLNHVVNARQLGGLKTKDGRTIKKDCLIRSGQLYMADEADVGKLKALNIKTIVDFRGSRERNQKPDAFVGEDNNFHLPVIREHNLAIERNDSAIDFSSSKGKTGDFMMDMSLEDPEAGKNFMNRCYRAFIEDAYQVSVYSQFIHRIIETKDGAVLWHCAGGKDRAGFGSIVILAILQFWVFQKKIYWKII